MEVISNYGTILLILTIAFGIFMAWGVGANDVANAMGTSVGAKAITIKQAIIIAMVFEFEVDFVYDLMSPDFKVSESSSGKSIQMPKCKYDVKIKDFYFYDEQGTRLKILPEFLSSIFDGGVSEEEKNELVKMAIKQVEEISKKVAKNIQLDVDKTTKETINNLIIGFNEHINSFKFYEKKISQDQVNIENPGFLEEKLKER